MENLNNENGTTLARVSVSTRDKAQTIASLLTASTGGRQKFSAREVIDTAVLQYAASLKDLKVPTP